MLASDFHCLSFESPWSWSPSSSSLRPPRRLRRRRLGRRHRLRRPGRRGPRRLPRRVAGGRGVAAGAGARLSARHVQRALTGGMAGRPHGQMCVRPRCRNHANAVAVPGAGGAVVLFESDSASAARPQDCCSSNPGISRHGRHTLAFLATAADAQSGAGDIGCGGRLGG